MAILSDGYAEELAELLADPIIDDMAADIRRGVDEGHIDSVDVVDGFHWMRRVNDRYRTLGGVKARTLGGVLTALRVRLGIAAAVEEAAATGVEV